VRDNCLSWSSETGYVDELEDDAPRAEPPAEAYALLERLRRLAPSGWVNSAAWDHWRQEGHQLREGCCTERQGVAT
jgi:hypothetical protein